jgi:hypothetical protein
VVILQEERYRSPIGEEGEGEGYQQGEPISSATQRKPNQHPLEVPATTTPSSLAFGEEEEAKEH